MPMIKDAAARDAIFVDDERIKKFATMIFSFDSDNKPIALPFLSADYMTDDDQITVDAFASLFVDHNIDESMITHIADLVVSVTYHHALCEEHVESAAKFLAAAMPNLMRQEFFVFNQPKHFSL